MRMRYLFALAVTIALALAWGCTDEDDRFVSGPARVDTDTMFLLDTIFMHDSIIQFVHDTTLMQDTVYMIMEMENPSVQYAFLALQAKTKSLVGKWGYYFYLTLDDVEVSGSDGHYEFRNGWFVLFNFHLCDRFFYKYNYDVSYVSGDPRNVSSWDISKPDGHSSGLSLSTDPPEWWPKTSAIPNITAAEGESK